MRTMPGNDLLSGRNKGLLKENEIHVWHVFAGSALPSGLQNVLTDQEIKRACGYYFAKDRENFIISRGVLRVLIARYLNTSSERVNLLFNEYGKPFLKGERALKFNVSHSNGILLFAFAWNYELGVDIELIRPDFADMEIAGRFFSKNEMLALSVLPDELRKIAFFNCWTRKEAYIKAKGMGLSIPLDSFDVSLCPGDPPELLCDHDAPEETGKWKLFNLNVPRDYCAALAVKGNPGEIIQLRWSGEITNNSSLLCPSFIRLQ
ncbi:MAG TPA: 4'-phosphopantetheinyl transferase superfamily protein [Ignavibacteriales bacterium]|nr:4'-phosphopantetheinyl transferase superfamily protein [Ignavibacteriales bacterium]